MKNAEHTSACNSHTCYSRYVDLEDYNAFMGYAEWKRTAANTCLPGQRYGRELCGDVDRQFGISSAGRLR